MSPLIAVGFLGLITVVVLLAGLLTGPVAGFDSRSPLATAATTGPSRDRLQADDPGAQAHVELLSRLRIIRP
jgi:uncharacterized protein (UPF0333 family)